MMMRSIYNKPIAMSALWGNAWQLFCRRWVQLLSATLIVTGVVLATLYLALTNMGAGTVTGFPYLLGVALFFIICLTVLTGRWLTDICFCDLHGKPVNISSSFMYVLHRLHWLLLYAVVMLLAIISGLVCLLIPGIALCLILPFGYFYILYDQKTVFQAFGHACSLVWGNWWRTWLVLTVPYVIYHVTISILKFFLLLSDFALEPGIASAPSGSAIGPWLLSVGLTGIMVPLVANMLYMAFAYCLLNCVFQDLLARQSLKAESS